MPKRSAGILMYRRGPQGLELLLVHPGGPFWAKRDLGAWSIPKGEYAPPEAALAAAVREFEEELGARPAGNFQPLGELAQPSRKIISAWALEGDFDPRDLKPGTFEMEWPPKSGRIAAFPEADRADWFSPTRAREKILAGQREFIARLERLIASLGGAPIAGVPRPARGERATGKSRNHKLGPVRGPLPES